MNTKKNNQKREKCLFFYVFNDYVDKLGYFRI